MSLSMASDPAPIGSQFGTLFSANDIRMHPLASSPASGFYHGGQSFSSQVNGSGGANGQSYDDVTTIFVVGFPDDMSEREFQNMFTFSPGFEAASLKWHCKDQEDEQGGVSANGGKKQMIGFARFRTRLEALEAVEVLNGKRVDQERGTLLKAEMAKKNLHIKRGSTVPQTTTAAVHAAAATADSISSPLSILSKKLHLPSSSGYDNFSPLPSDLLSPTDYNRADPFMADPFRKPSTPTTPMFSDGIFGGFRSQSIDVRNSEAAFMSPPRAGGGFGLIPPARMAKAMQEGSDNDPFNYLSKSSPVPNERAFGASSSSPPQPTSSSLLGGGEPLRSMRMGSLSLHTGNLEFRSPSISSPSYNQSSTSSGRSFNPADQNPPCNTLYVGNLPPNTSEDELRQLFSKCRGYKRMSFRTKSQGPMCFVEFEDVVYATQAMHDLQGSCLTNSIKGGIRLSFSKNPLFTKPGKDGKREPGSDGQQQPQP